MCSAGWLITYSVFHIGAGLIAAPKAWTTECIHTPSPSFYVHYLPKEVMFSLCLFVC